MKAAKRPHLYIAPGHIDDELGVPTASNHSDELGYLACGSTTRPSISGAPAARSSARRWLACLRRGCRWRCCGCKLREFSATTSAWVRCFGDHDPRGRAGRALRRCRRPHEPIRVGDFAAAADGGWAQQGAWSSYNPAHKPDHSKPHPDATYGLGYLLPVVDAAATHRAPSYIIDAAAIGTALRLFVPSGSGVHDQLLRPADRLLQYSHDFRCGHAFSARPLSRSTTPARCSPSPPRRSSRPWTNVSPRRLSPAGRCS
jgi:hypothetical protein